MLNGTKLICWVTGQRRVPEQEQEKEQRHGHSSHAVVAIKSSLECQVVIQAHISS